MRSEVRLLAVLAIAIVTIAVPTWIVSRSLPVGTDYAFVTGEAAAVTPVPLKEKDGERRLTVDVPQLPNLRDTRVGVRVATYARRPTQTIRFDLLGAKRKLLRSCSIPPSDYTDNGTITCAVARPDQVRRIAIAVHGEPFALYAADEGGKLVAGTLVETHRFTSLHARVDALGERVAVTRPALVSPAGLLVALIASVALLGTGLLLAVGRE